MKLASILLILFLGGCSSMDMISGVNFLKDKIEKPQPLPPAEVVAEDALSEEKFYNSEHNWNNSKNNQVKPLDKKPEPINIQPKKNKEPEEKKDFPLPWPLIIIALVSGGMYFINRFKQYREKI